MEKGLLNLFFNYPVRYTSKPSQKQGKSHSLKGSLTDHSSRNLVYHSLNYVRENSCFSFPQ